MSDSFDVVILGAGIAGCACARECADAGMRVAIVERDMPGGGATAAGMGHIVVMDDTPAQLALTHYARTLWQQQMAELPKAVEYEARGTLWVATNEEEMAEVHTKHATYERAGIRSEILDAATLVEQEPRLRAGLAGALLVPDDAVLYPPTAAVYFLEMAQRSGATFIHGAAISAAAGVVRLSDGTTLATGRIVAATGADTRIFPWLRLQKRKGHLVITDRYPGFVRHQLVELGYLKSAHAIATDSVAFNIQPRQTGQMLIGSSRQYGKEDPVADATIVAAMLARAYAYMPDLAALSAIRVWTGFRAATPDKLPLIGPTHDPTLFLLAGFEGLGITIAPGAARIVVDQMLGRSSALDPVPYLPERILEAEPLHA